jgi:hypothetical protein
LLRFVRDECQNVARLNSANFHAFHAATFAAEDSNSGFRRFQKRSEVFANSFVGAIFDSGRLDPDFERAVDDTCDFVAACARLHAQRKHNASISRNEVELLARTRTKSAIRTGIGRALQDITKRVGIARAAQSWCAVPARRAAASTDRARIRAPEI